MKRINDLYVVAFLKSIGYEPKNYEAIGSKLIWYFDNEEQINREIDLYYAGKQICNPLRLVQCIRDLKGLIFSILK